MAMKDAPLAAEFSTPTPGGLSLEFYDGGLRHLIHLTIAFVYVGGLLLVLAASIHLQAPVFNFVILPGYVLLGFAWLYGVFGRYRLCEQQALRMYLPLPAMSRLELLRHVYQTPALLEQCSSPPSLEDWRVAARRERRRADAILVILLGALAFVLVSGTFWPSPERLHVLQVILLMPLIASGFLHRRRVRSMEGLLEEQIQADQAASPLRCILNSQGSPLHRDWLLGSVYLKVTDGRRYVCFCDVLGDFDLPVMARAIEDNSQDSTISESRAGETG